MKTVLFMLTTLLFIGCGSKGTSHLPSIFELPGAIISNGVDNTIYNSKRKKVTSYVKENYDVLKQEFLQANGEHLDKVLSLAKIKKAKYPKIKEQLKQSHKTIFHNTQSMTEQIMMLFSKLYMPKQKDKKMNGFSYFEASNIVYNYVDSNFENLRKDIKDGKTTQLEEISKKLNIIQKDKYQSFIHGLDGKYDEFYIDKVVVSVMINSN